MEEPKYNKPDYNNPNIKPVVFDLSEIDKKLSPAQLMPKEQIKARELQSEVSAKQSKLQSYSYPTYMVDKLGNAFKPNFDNIDLKYKELIQAENDAKADAQSWYGNLGRGLGNVLNTAVTGILATPGYVGAMIEAGLTDKTIGETTDNAWINFFEEAKKSIGETAFKTYVPSDVSEGGLWNKMTSGAWLATTGAEGLGTMLQLIVPGAALKGLSLGSKFAKGTRLTKLFTDEAKVGKFLKNADDFTAATFNASLEASMEAHESFKNIYGQLKSKVDSGVMTDKEAREIAGEQSSKVFTTNMALLFVPNMIDQKWIFGGTASGSYIERKLAGALSEEAVKPAGKKWYSMIPSAVGALGKGFIKEGGEEGVQFATQEYFKNQATGKNEDPNWITGIIGEFYDGMMNSDEFAESVFLGGVLGSPLSVIGKINEKKFEKEFLYGRNASNPGALKRFMGVTAKNSSEGILKILKDNYMNNFTEHTDIFEKDAKGNVKLDEKTNRPIITPAKRAKLIMDLLAKDVNKMDMVFAKAVGDELLFESKRDESLYNFMRPYFAVDGGRQVFEQHIDRIAEQEKRNLESLGDTRGVDEIKSELKEKYMTFQNQFMKVSNSMNSTNKLTKEQKKATPEFDALLTNVTMMHYLDQTNLRKAIDKAETEITELERSPLQMNQKLAEPLKKRKAKLEESLKNSEEQALKFMTKEGQNELLDRYLKRQKEGAEAIVQTEAEEDINASAQTIKSIDHANIYRQGTTIDSTTNIKYHGGVTITNEEGQSYQADIIGLENGELKVRDKSGKEFTIKSDGTINGIPVTVKNSYPPKIPKKATTTEVVDSTEEVNQEEAFSNSAKRAYKEEPHPVFTGNITDFFRTKGFQEMYQKNPEKYKPYLEFYTFIDNYNEEVSETSSDFRTLRAHTLNTLPPNIKRSLSKELIAELERYPNSILLVVMNGKTPILQNGSHVIQLLPEPLLYGDVETIDREERYPLFSYDKFREAYGEGVTDEIITAALQKRAEQFTEFRQRIIESPEPINFRILDKNQGVLVVDANMEFTSVVGKLVATKEEIYAVDIQISKNKVDEGIVYFKHKGAKIPANREKLSNADIKRVVNLMKYYVSATSATDRENAFEGLKNILHIVYQSKGQKTPGKFTFFPTKFEKGEITGFKYGEWSISKEDLLADNTEHLEGKFLQDKFYAVDKKSLEGYNQVQDFYSYDVKDGKLVSTLYKIEDGGYKKYLLEGDKPKLTVKIKPLGDTQFLSRSFNIDPINLPIPKMTEEEVKIVQDDIKTPIVETDEFSNSDFAPGEEPTVDAKADIERRKGLNGVGEIIFSNPNFRLEGFEIDGNYWNVVTSTDRAKVLVNINGVIVPFYLTTGQAGKGLVPGWYPFFGIGKDGWLNKTDKSDMETYYERYWGKETANIVKSISEELNSFYGTDPSTFINDGDPNATSRPLSTLADKVEDYINSKLSYTPAINNADARKTLRGNVEQLGKEINAKYDAEVDALEGKPSEDNYSSPDSDALFKVYNPSDITGVTTEAIKEFRKKFKGFDLRFIGNGLINGIGVAAVTKNMEVIISDFANDGTLNHEAFHIVSQFFTSSKTRARLYNETRQRLGKPEMTDLEAEEFLADEYEQFMENPKTYKFNKGQEVKKSVFTRIWNAIKSFFGVETVEEMFKKIANTNYSKTDVINKPSDFKYLYKIKGLDESTTMKLIKHYNVIFFDRLFYDKGFSGAVLNLDETIINKIYDSVRDVIKTSNKSENKVLAKYLKEVENHHKKYLNQYGFQLEFERPDNEQYIESNKISQLVHMPSPVKLLIAGLSKKERGFNYGTFARTADNFSETVDFDATLNILNRELANLPEDLIFPKLAELYNERKHPEFKTLLDRLGVSLNINTEVRGGLIDITNVISPNATKHQVQLQTIFLNTFTQNLSNPLMAVVSRENPVIFVDQSADTIQEKVLAEWKSNLRGSGNSYFTYKNGKFLLDTTALYKLPNGVKVPILEVSKQGDINKLFKRYSDIADYLAVFGITITDNQKSRKLGISIIQNLSTNLAAIEAPTLDDVFNKDTGKINKELKALAIIELTYSKKNVSNQSINGKGQTEYSISLPNKLSHVIADNKNGVSNDYEPYSASNPNGNLQTVHHTWNYDTLDLVLLRSVKADFEDARDISDSKKGDFIVTEVNAILSNINPFLRAADRGLEYAFRDSTTLNNEFKITTIQMVDSFIPYLENEIIIALAYQNDPKAKHFVKSGKTANELQFFKDIIPSLNVQAVADKSNYQEVAKNIIKENINIIKSDIGKYVDSQIKETLNLFIGWRLVDISADVYTNNGFSNDILGKLNSEKILDKSGLEQLARTFSYLYIKGGLDQMKHLMGNLSTYNKGVASELHKRTTLNAATKQATRNSQEFNEWLNKNEKRADGFEHTKLQRNWVIQDQEVASYLADQMKELGIPGYNSMTENDAQGLASLDGYKSLMYRSKEGWNDKKENTYQYEMQSFVYTEIYNNPKYKNHQKKIDSFFKENLPEGWKGVPMVKGVPIKIEDMESLTVVKPQGVGVIQNEEFKTFGQISHTKTSIAPILYSNVKDSKLKDLLVEMFIEGIDFVFPKSAKKGDMLGNANGELPALYDEKGEIKSITQSIAEGYQVENLLWNDMGIQLDIDPSGKKKIKQSIQQESLKSVNVFDKGISVEGKEDLKKLVATDKELKDLRKERLFDQLVIDLGLTKIDGTWKIEFPEKFERVMAGEFSRKNYSQNTFQAIREVINSEEKNFDTINVSDKVDNLLNSLVNNNLITQKVKGDMMVQQASTGYETSNRDVTKSNFLKSYEIERDSEGNITKVNPAECMIPLPKEWIKLVNKEEGKNFNEKLDKFNKKIQSKYWDKLLTFNSNRTPTPDLNAMEVMRVAKFLVPWSGSTIIVPTEIVVKAGSDFDVDKLNAYLNNYKFDEEGNPIYLDEGNVSSRYEAYILDSLNKVRKQDINAYKETVDSIEEDIKQELNYLKNKNKTWDKVSVDAIKEQLKERKFDLILEDFNLMSFTDFEKLSQYEQMTLDQIDNIISQNTMQFILHPSNYKSLMSPTGSDTINNAVEKIVKRPKQDKRNLHELMSFKKNMNYGFAQWKANAVLGSAANNTTFHSKVQQSPIALNEDLVLLSFEGVSNSLGNITNEAEELISTLLGQYLSAAADAAKESEPALTKANISPSTANLALLLTGLKVKTEHIIKFLTDVDIINYELERETQEAKFLQVQDKQKKKSDIIESLTGYDKKKQNRMMHNIFKGILAKNPDYTIGMLKERYNEKFAKGAFVEDKLEYFLYLTEVAKVYGELVQLTKHDSGMPKNRDTVAYREERLNDLIETNVFKGIDEFFENTFMGKFREMHLKGTELFDDFFTRTSDARFAGFLFDMMAPYKDAKVKEDILISVQRKLTKKTLAYIIHNSPTNTIKDKYADLLKGENSLAKRLLKLKNSDNPIKENAFIQELVPVIEEYIDRRKENLEFDYIRKFSSKLSTYEEDSLADAFKEIMESSDESIRQLGSDIIYASIIQSGLNKSASSFFDAIPVEYFYPIASEALKQFKDSDLDILDESAKESIYQNSWMDKDIVRKQDSYVNGDPIFSPEKSYIAIPELYSNANFNYLTVEYKNKDGAKEIFLYKKGILFDAGDKTPYFKYQYDRIDKKGEGNKFAEFIPPSQLSMIKGNNVEETVATTTENINTEEDTFEYDDSFTIVQIEEESTQSSTSVKPNIPIKIKKDAKSNWNLELTQYGKVINVNTGQEVDEKTKNKALTKHAFQTGFGTKFSYNNTEYAAIITNSHNTSLSEFKIVSLSESNMGGEVFKQGTPQYNKIIKDNNNVVELLQKICSL